MDGLIGRLLGVLADTSFGEETLVAYTSDHGEMAGEHGMWWKNSFYEGSVRVPMIWSWPGRLQENVRVAAVSSLLDVAPTLLDLAGAEPLPQVSGRSLRRFLEEGLPPAEWPDRALAENVSGYLQERPGRMIRQGPWKLNHYHGFEGPQLFNLEEDPDELCDRAGDPACAHVREELLARVLEGWDGDAIETRLQGQVEARKLLRQWGASVPHDLSDFWRAPPGCNIFPEE
jgi:choline-sulfatase